VQASRAIFSFLRNGMLGGFELLDGEVYAAFVGAGMNGQEGLFEEIPIGF
jgi:hypothetical protein